MSRDVFANGFGQTGGSNANNSGFVLLNDVFDAGNEIATSTVNSCFLAEITGCNIYRFFKMTDHIPANVGSTTLTAMNKRYAAFDALEHHRCTQRGT